MLNSMPEGPGHGRMPPWHFPIPLLQSEGICTLFLRLPAHSIHDHTVNIFLLSNAMGGDLPPGCLADRLVAGLSQPKINPQVKTQKRKALCFADEGTQEQSENSLDAAKKGCVSDLQIYKGLRIG
eukprot:1148720-Pelagomonas_calceolata.AAC.3